jgi:hypothetical protein
LQTGWGAITPAKERQVVQETLAHLGVSGKVGRTKDANACAFMTNHIRARRAYWNNVAVRGQSFGTSEDPYIYC